MSKLKICLFALLFSSLNCNAIDQILEDKSYFEFNVAKLKVGTWFTLMDTEFLSSRPYYYKISSVEAFEFRNGAYIGNIKLMGHEDKRIVHFVM